MPIELVKEKYSSPINTVEIGTAGTGAVKIGGESCLPFLFDEGNMPNAPVVALEILDCEPSDWPDALKKPYGDSLKDPAGWAAKCVKDLGARLLCVRLQSTHPDCGSKNADHVIPILKSVIREAKDIFGKNTKIALLGIAPSQKIENVRYGFFQSFGMGFKKLIDLTVLTYKALWYIVTGRMSMKESMTGPIGIYIIAGKAAQMGFIYLVHLMALLSASLAIFNLLPLPVLDGGHILFLIIEKLRGKPLSMKAQEIISNIGIGFLILLTVFIFYSDITKFRIFEGIFKFFKR